MIVNRNIYNFEMNILNQTYNSLNKGNTSQIALNLLFHLNTNSEDRQDNNNVHEQMLALSSAKCAQLTAAGQLTRPKMQCKISRPLPLPRQLGPANQVIDFPITHAQSILILLLCNLYLRFPTPTDRKYVI